ncbi:hypothetical protein JCM17823_04900 [Halorubrum gandharaense]
MQQSASKDQYEDSDKNTHVGSKWEFMPAEEREDEVLLFLYEHGIALPPKAIFRGLKVERDITFSYRTIQNILSRLNDSGHVMRCDKEALDQGEIQPLSEDQSGRRTYYYITESGIERIGE